LGRFAIFTISSYIVSIFDIYLKHSYIQGASVMSVFMLCSLVYQSRAHDTHALWPHYRSPNS
jgi:hypothetical protein